MSSSFCSSRVLESEVRENSLIKRRETDVGLSGPLVHWWGEEWMETPLSLCLSGLLLSSYVFRVELSLIMCRWCGRQRGEIQARLTKDKMIEEVLRCP